MTRWWAVAPQLQHKQVTRQLRENFQIKAVTLLVSEKEGPFLFWKGENISSHVSLEKELASSQLTSVAGRSGWGVWAGMWSRLTRICLQVFCFGLGFLRKFSQAMCPYLICGIPYLHETLFQDLVMEKSCEICSSRELDRISLGDRTGFSLLSVAVHSLHSLGDQRSRGWSQPHGKQGNCMSYCFVCCGPQTL